MLEFFKIISMSNKENQARALEDYSRPRRSTDEHPRYSGQFLPFILIYLSVSEVTILNEQLLPGGKTFKQHNLKFKGMHSDNSLVQTKLL